MAEAEAEDVFRCTWLEAESAAADTVVEVSANEDAAAEQRATLLRAGFLPHSSYIGKHWTKPAYVLNRRVEPYTYFLW